MTSLGVRCRPLAALLLFATVATADVPDAFRTITAFEDRRESAPALHAFLGDEDATVRARAALAVGRIGRSEDAARLTPLLEDGDTNVRRSVAFALGEIGDSTAVHPLATLLVSGGEPSADVRATALHALGKAHQGAEACRQALTDDDPRVRGEALMAAWQIPVPNVLDAVLAATEEENVEVRWRAAYCLMRLAGARASGRTPIAAVTALSWEERDRAEPVLRQLVRDVDPRVRVNAVRGLRSFGSDVATAALVSVSEDDDWRVRAEAIRALAADVRVPPDSEEDEEGSETRPREARLSFVDPHMDDSHPNVRIVTIEALARIGDDADVAGRLRPLLGHATPRVREVAFRSMIARWQSADSLSAVTLEDVDNLAHHFAHDPDWTLRAAAIDAAALLPPERQRAVVEPLTEGDGRVAKLAVPATLTLLADAGTQPSLMERLEPAWSRALAHEDPMVRLMAIDALSELFQADSVYAPTDADRRALDRVLTETYDASMDPALTDLREVAVTAAANWPDRPACRKLVERGCQDPNYVVRLRAMAAAEEAGIESPRATAEPVDTGRSPKDYAPILKWAEKSHVAEFDTEAGAITAVLFSRDAPLTCWNFARLANEGFYDGGAWHRVVPDFVLQDGCPRGDGWGGPPWQIRCEINEHPYDRGALGMALSGKDTGGSQFFFTHAAQPHLDGGYTVFGHVLSGQDVVDALVQGSAIRSIRVVERKP